MTIRSFASTLAANGSWIGVAVLVPVGAALLAGAALVEIGQMLLRLADAACAACVDPSQAIATAASAAGTAGAAAAAAAAAGSEPYGPPIARTSAERDGLPPNYTTPGRSGSWPGFGHDAGAPPTVERNGRLYVKDYWKGAFQGYREVYPIPGVEGFYDPGESGPPADLFGMRG